MHEEPTDESASLPLRKSRRVSNASNLRFKRGECVGTCSMIDCGITQAVRSFWGWNDACGILPKMNATINFKQRGFKQRGYLTSKWKSTGSEN